MSRHRARLCYKQPEHVQPCAAQQPYLELVSLPADAAREAWLLYQLFHLLQERSLGHHLALFICLEGNTGGISQEDSHMPLTLA